MVDWWFDWHPRDPLRYRVWHPAAHRSNSLELPRGDAAPAPGAKAHWGAVHHPVEDVGIGVVHARIAFRRAERDGAAERRARRPARGDASSAATSATTAAACATRRWSTYSCARATASCCAAASGSAPPCAPTASARRGAGERVLNNRLARRATLPRDAAASARDALRRGVREPRRACCRSCSSASLSVAVSAGERCGSVVS